MESFYKALGSLLPVIPLSQKIRWVRAVHYIVNGGQDPQQGPPTEEFLRHAPRNSIVERPYLMSRLARSGLLPMVVEAFLQAAQSLDYGAGGDELTRLMLNSEQSPSRVQTDQQQEEEEDLTLYGLPPRPKKGNAANENNGFDALLQPPEPSPAAAVSSTSKGKDEKTMLWELTQALLDLCLEITTDDTCAIILCEAGLCHAVLVLLDKDFRHDPHDRRLSYLVELMWNMLEPFCNQMNQQKPNHKSNKSLTRKSQQQHNNSSSTSLNSNYEDNPVILAVLHGNILDRAFAIDVLFRLLDFLLLEGYRAADKEFRNMCLVVLSLLADFPQAVGYFLQSGLFTWLVTYASVEENGGVATWLFYHKPVANLRNFATTADVDLEFKKQIWMLLSQLVNGSLDSDALLCIAASPLLSCLLQYLEQAPIEANAPGGGATMKGGKTGTPSSLHPHSQQQQSVQMMQMMQMSSSVLNDNSLLLLPEATGTQQHHQQSKKGGPLQQLSQHSSSLHQQTPHNATSNNNNNNNNSTALNKTSSVKTKTFLTSLTPAKLREFQVQAILALLQIAPKILAEFERLNGIPRLWQLVLQHCTSKVPEHIQVTFYSLVLLHRALLNARSVRHALEHQFAGVRCCLQVFLCAQDEECQAQAVRLLASLCSPDQELCQQQLLQEGELLAQFLPHNHHAHLQQQSSHHHQHNQSQSMHQGTMNNNHSYNGIRLLLDPIRSYVRKRLPIVGLKAGVSLHSKSGGAHEGKDPLPDPLETAASGEVSVLIIAIVDCLRAAVVNASTANVTAFADAEGMDLLLDLLEVSPVPLRLQVLRTLGDLLLYHGDELSAFVHCWRSSKTLRSANEILCHAWLDEECRLNATRSMHQGVLTQLVDPLISQPWPISIAEQPLLGFHNDGFHNTFASSSTVTKLAQAILAGRAAVQTNLPSDLTQTALDTADARCVLSQILGHLGLYETYRMRPATNPFQQPQQQVGSLDGYGGASSPQSYTQMHPNNNSNNSGVLPSPSSRNVPGSLTLTPANNQTGSQHDNTLSRTQNNNRNNTQLASGALPPITEALYHTNSTAPSHNHMHNQTNQNNNNGSEDQDGSGATGFDHVTLGCREQQVLSLAHKHHLLREASWWRQVQQHLDVTHTVAIESDAVLIQARLDAAWDAALATQTEQLLLLDQETAAQRDAESGFLGQILTKKAQQIKAEWIKRNAKGGPLKKKGVKKVLTMGSASSTTM